MKRRFFLANLVTGEESWGGSLLLPVIRRSGVSLEMLWTQESDKQWARKYSCLR
jgi:hypothetical protein